MEQIISLIHQLGYTKNSLKTPNIAYTFHLYVRSNIPAGTLGSVASLLAATLYQGNPDRNHKLWNIVSTERDIYSLVMEVLLECCYVHINGK
jgi:hypothetical protein